MTCHQPISMRIALLAGVVGIPTIPMIAPARAQTIAAAATTQDAVVTDDILVTARKRGEALIEVPDAITVFTAGQIENRRLTQIGDLIALTPNVNFTKDQDAGTNIISIRGIGANRNQAAAVAFVVDGVILPDSDAFTVDLSDAERVEVLKGPQGALYGKGAIAGAINIVTRKPTPNLEFQGRASYGSGDTFNVYGSVSGPIVGDRLLGLLSVKYRNSDGTTINQFDGKSVDFDEFVKVSGRLIFEASDRVNFDLRGSYYDQTAGASWYSTPDVLGTTGGRISRRLADTNPNIDQPQYTKREIIDVSLTSTIGTDIGTLSLVSAYDKVDLSLSEELDWTPLALVPSLEQSRKIEGWSQEVRFASPDANRLRYIVGAYYQNTKRDVTTNGQFDLCLFTTGCVPPAGAVSGVILPLSLSATSVKAQQYAGFGQLNYDIVDAIELTLALRYDRDVRKQHDVLRNRDDKATFSAWQPKASLAYKPNRNLTVYATYSEGYKSGTFNPAPGANATFPLIVKQEGTKNAEIGLKTNLFDRRVTLNAAAFSTRYTNPQIFQFDAETGGQVTINAARAQLTGFEADIMARPAEGLTLNAAFGYTRSRIKRFDNTDRFKGQALPNMPEYTVNLGAEYAIKFGENYTLTPRVDYHHLGKTSFQDFQGPDPDVFVFQPHYGTLDAQIALTGDGGWTFTLFGKNLTSTNYATAAFSRYANALVAVPLGRDIIFIDQGTTVGAELRITF